MAGPSKDQAPNKKLSQDESAPAEETPSKDAKAPENRPTSTKDTCLAGEDVCADSLRYAEKSLAGQVIAENEDASSTTGPAARKCPFCGETFGGIGASVRHGFDSHGLGFTSPPLAVCRICSSSRSSPQSLYQHIAQEHPQHVPFESFCALPGLLFNSSEQ